MRWKKLEKFASQGIYGAEFDRGPRYTNWRPEGSADILLLFTLEGCGRVGNALQQHPLKPGRLALFELGAEQVYFTDPSLRRWKFLWAHFRPLPHWKSWMSWQMAVPGMRMAECPSEAVARNVEVSFREMVRRVRQPGKLAVDLAYNALERAILLVTPEPSQVGSGDARIEQALEILSHEIDTPFSMEQVAHRCGLSPSRLAHLFKASTGQSPQRYSEERKMLHAAQLLHLSDLSVQEAGRACGYEDPYYFSNRFRQWWGLSPRAYREARTSDLPPRLALSGSQRPSRASA